MIRYLRGWVGTGISALAWVAGVGEVISTGEVFHWVRPLGAVPVFVRPVRVQPLYVRPGLE